MSGHRTARVADAIHRLLAPMIQGLRDPRIGFVTVTEVQVSPDLRHARVYFTLLGTTSPGETARALEHAEPFLRRALAREGGLRFVPNLRFLHDESVDTGLRVESILRDLDIEPEADPQGEEE